MQNVTSRAGAEKRHVDWALHTMQAEIDYIIHRAKNSEEKAKKAMVDGWYLYLNKTMYQFSTSQRRPLKLKTADGNENAMLG